MSFGCPLKHLSLQHLAESRATLTPYQLAVQAVLLGNKPDLDFLREVAKVSEEELVDKWRSLLGGSLLVALSGQNSRTLQDGILAHAEVPFWSEDHHLTALKALTEQLFGLSSKSFTPDICENCPWVACRSPRTQAELGLFWCMLGLIQKDLQFIEGAKEVAELQKNYLDNDLSPLFGGELALVFNYLLFRAVAVATDSQEFATLARRHAAHLKHGAFIPLEALLIERWLEYDKKEFEEVVVELPSYVMHPPASLVGVRSARHSAFCTLASGNEGMGMIRKGDAQILKYGPGPIEGVSDPAHIVQNKDGFAIKRSMRLRPGIWVDAKQVYAQETLDVRTDYYGYESLDQLNFTFLGKAKNCLLSNGQLVKERYAGSPRPVTLQADQGMITLIPEKGFLSMQVECVSATNYLIIFQIDAKNARCQWKISL